jgi:hypothetical protein
MLKISVYISTSCKQCAGTLTPAPAGDHVMHRAGRGPPGVRLIRSTTSELWRLVKLRAGRAIT